MRTIATKPFSLLKVLFLALCLALTCGVVTSFAAEVGSGNPSVDGSKTASPTELTQDSRQTEVTLTLPSAEYKHEYDIVFVMDSSTSTKNNNIDFSIYVDDLLGSVADKNATINVGVVKFRGLAFAQLRIFPDPEQRNV